MLRSLALIPLTLALTAPPLLAAAKPPVSLARVGKWEVNYDKEACHLLATFGEGDGSILAKMTRYQPGDSLDLTLYGKSLRTEQANLPVTVSFGPKGSPSNRLANAGHIGDKLPLLIVGPVRLDNWNGDIGREVPPMVSEAREEAVQTLTIARQGKGDLIVLQTGSFALPMKALRACVDDLLTSWGYDSAARQSLATAPIPKTSPATWVGGYPWKANYARHQGLVQFRLDVDASGSVAACHVLYRTNPDEFADSVCNWLSKRAKFVPAKGKDGSPTRWFYVGKVRFMIPGG